MAIHLLTVDDLLSMTLSEVISEDHFNSYLIVKSEISKLAYL